MLRPSGPLLASSKADRSRSVRQERVRTVGRLGRAVSAVVGDAWGALVDLVVLIVLPFAYLASAYLLLDLPGRLVAGKVGFGGIGALVFLAAAAISVLGVVRALREAAPVVPVRPEFAKAMLLAGWVAALLLTVADLAG
jgi:hypothetical protein